ncbi:MAG: hypothetical protein ABSD75_08390 [Terriglobales bacterium]|jgi:hypothetical protein
MHPVGADRKQVGIANVAQAPDLAPDLTIKARQRLAGTLGIAVSSPDLLLRPTIRRLPDSRGDPARASPLGNAPQALSLL